MCKCKGKGGRAVSIKGWRHNKFKKRGSMLQLVGGVATMQDTAFRYRHRASHVVQGASRREGRGVGVSLVGMRGSSSVKLHVCVHGSFL